MRSWRVNIITPVIGLVISFLEPSQLPGSKQPMLLNAVAQQVPIYTPGWREAASIRTHILTTWPSEHKSDALNRSAMALRSAMAPHYPILISAQRDLIIGFVWPIIIRIKGPVK